jgi:3-hydroxy-9,10-secoandrosta-1,3,5(10)-triene-9,17-dione monooxygenase
MVNTDGHTARPTQAELRERAVALQPLLREHSPAGEIRRRLPDEVIDALTEAGMFRLRTPGRFGGYGADVRTVLDVTVALGEADGSAAWLVGLSATGAWVSGRASQQAQQEIYGSNPDARLAGNFTPLPGRPVDGGVLVSGRWHFASGSLHAQWASIGVLVSGDADAPGRPYWCIVPAAEMTLEDTWQTIGMRGTGSNTWVGENVFIPTHRMVDIAGLVDGPPPRASDDPAQRLTLIPLATLDLFGPILGMGQAALALAVQKAPAKAMHPNFFEHRSSSVGLQLQVAEAALKLQTARLHAYQVAEELDRSAADGPLLEYADRARFKAVCGYATLQVIEALQLLLDAHGSRSFFEDNPMQQYWRDASTAARHIGLNASIGLEVFGKSLLAVSEKITPLV